MITRNIAVILSGRDAGLARTLGAAAGALHAFDTKIGGASRRSAMLAAGLKTAFAAIAVAAAVGLGAAIKSAVDFDVAMRNANTVAHLSEGQFRNMSSAILDLSTKVPQSATVLADGLRDIAGSGFAGADAFQILEVSARAASAGMTDTETASKTVVAVLNAYGLGAEHAAEVSDVLFSTVEYGVVTFEELAGSMGDVIAGAAVAGVSFEEVGSAIATMTLSGLSASEATTSLNRLIREIIDPGKRLRTLFVEMGFASGAMALEQKGLHGTMELIRKSTGGSVVELQKLFPEIRAARGAYALMTAEGMTYSRIQRQITDDQSRAGATQRAFKEQMKATGNQARLLGNQFQALGIKIGTALLPHINKAIEWIRKVGPQIGDTLRNAWQRAQPAIEALGRAISSIGDMFQSVWQASKPFITLLAGVTFGAAIGALHGLANAISFVANLLADHPGIVQAVAAVYGSLLVGRIITAAGAFLRLQAGLMAVRAGLAALTAQSVISALAGRLQLLGSAIGAVFTMGNLQNLRNFGGAFQGLGAALTKAGPALAGAAIVGGLYALSESLDNAKRKAQDFRESLESQFNTDTLQGKQNYIARLKSELEQLDEEWDNMIGTGNEVTRVIRGTVESFSPLPNKVADNTAATNELRRELEEVEQVTGRWEHDLNTLSNMLGISTQEVQFWLNAIDYDPTDFSTNTDILAQQIRETAFAAQQATPAATDLAAAIETMEDPTSSVTDRIGALEESIKSLIGTVLGARDAEVQWHQAMADVEESLKEHGKNVNLNTQEGRDNASAMIDAANAALQLAIARAEETGMLSDGVDVLRLHREAMINQMTQYGWTRQAAEQYLDTLGLTPENLETLVNLTGVEQALLSAQEYQTMLDLLNQAEATSRVNIDTSDFDDNWVKIGLVLMQIDKANPEADVLLNGDFFKPTAEMVNAWADTWDSRSPEAQALLSIIDPEGKFETLEQAAMAWNSAEPEAEARLNNANAMENIRAAKEQLMSWDADIGTATADANNLPARNKIHAAKDELFSWDRSSGTATANANNNQAVSALNAVQSKLFTWGSSSGTGTAKVNDLASGPLSSIFAMIRSLNGQNAVVTVTHRTVFEEQRRGFRTSGPQLQRYGGVTNAQHGLAQAGIFRTPTVYFAEPETGGEAFIPRFGNANRSKAILQQAAGWYGLEVRPRGGGGGGGGSGGGVNTVINISVKARGSIANSDELVRRMRAEIDGAMRIHDQQLARSLGMH